MAYDAALKQARAYADVVRYSKDKATHGHIVSRHLIKKQQDMLLRSSLLMSESLTPELSKKFDEVCEKLGVPRDAVNVFIQADSTIQAACLYSSSHECLIQFSSGLINLLDSDEFGFVAGHELGHFLLEHGAGDFQKESIEYFIQSRAQEISVDRLGLIATGNLDASMSALVKAASGLENRHLRFDVGAFISQAKKISQPQRGEGFASTHPSILTRCRALLWFSTDTTYKDYPVTKQSPELTKLNATIEKELNKFVEGPIREEINTVKKEIALWLAASIIIKDGRFDKDEQQKIKNLFGDVILDKLKRFLSDSNKDTLSHDIANKLAYSKKKLEHMMPVNFEKLYSEVEKFIAEKLA
ncbi:MAG: M48 family metallopeptidase [Alphaproteobacteria bacterium GM202ARS2]|nr:M48 family metallopeptidase [Alphaproteobacteria bacterium GM202ARS2]